MTDQRPLEDYRSQLEPLLEELAALLTADEPERAELLRAVDGCLQASLWSGFDREEGYFERLRERLTELELTAEEVPAALVVLLERLAVHLEALPEGDPAAVEEALDRLADLPSAEPPTEETLEQLLERGAELADALEAEAPDAQAVAALVELLRRLRENHDDERVNALWQAAYEELENARRAGAPPGTEAVHTIRAAFAAAAGRPDETAAGDVEVTAGKPTVEDDSLAEQLFGGYKPRQGETAAPAEPPPEEAEPAAVVSDADGGVRSEMLDIFTAEAEELIDQLNSNLLLLENETDNLELIRELMREAHTLKGAAAMLGFNAMSRTAKAMEDLLSRADELERAVPVDGVDLLFELTDIAALLLETVVEQGREVVTVEETHRRIRELTAGVAELLGGFEEPDRTPAEAAAPRGEVSGVARSHGFRVDPARLDVLLNLAGELVITRTRIDEIITELADLSDGYTEQLAELQAAARRLNEYAARGVGVAAGADTGTRHSTISDFSPHEFDRFSELDALNRDLSGQGSDFSNLNENYQRAVGLLSEHLNELSLIAGNIQDEVTLVRMVPFASVATRFRRAARDIARYYGKELNFEVSGEQTEIDKKLLDDLLTPITHLIRNAVAHGVETPDERRVLGKPVRGTVSLEAYHLGNSVVLEVYDDGAGIDPRAVGRRALELGLISREEFDSADDETLRELIFRPGFSTAAELTETAGRGFGLDIVAKRLKEIKGTLDLKSEPGAYTRFILTLPLTLGISEGLFVTVGGQTFALPLTEVEETLMLVPDDLTSLSGREVYRHRGDLLPLRRLDELFDLPSQTTEQFLVIVRQSERRVGLVVDELVGKQEMVVKPTGGLLKNLPMFGGSTTLGDGSVALIINPDDLIGRAPQRRPAAALEAEEPPPAPATELQRPDKTDVEDQPAPRRTKPRREKLTLTPDSAGEGYGVRVLLVDDSVSIRNFVGRMLSRRGFSVLTAADGLEALDILEREEIDCVLTDLEMPRMHGYELISEIKSNSRTRHLPVMILTARTGEKHRQRAQELGVETFLTKPFNEERLVKQLLQLSGR